MLRACRRCAGGRVVLTLFGVWGLAGCAGPDPSFERLRMEGLRQMVAGNYAGARGLFREAHRLKPEDAVNLHDLGDCCLYFARDQFEQLNTPAAQRELDKAVECYTRSTNARPGFQPAIIGKNNALELKGESEQALALAEWARKYVGPSVRQQVWLAHEYEQRGDMDTAELRYRQAVSMDKDSALAHAELGKFYYRLKLTDRALPHLERALTLDPKAPGVADLLEEARARGSSVASAPPDGPG